MRQLTGSFDYIWFLEFQKRGAPHIHIMTSVLEPRDSTRGWFAGLWAGISTDGNNWPYSQLHEVTRGYIRGADLMTQDAVRYHHTTEVKAWENFRSSDGAARYAAKYCLKTWQKTVPKCYSDVGRFWGASRSMKPPIGEIVYGTEQQIREFLQAKGREVDNWEVLPKFVFY